MHNSRPGTPTAKEPFEKPLSTALFWRLFDPKLISVDLFVNSGRADREG